MPCAGCRLELYLSGELLFGPGPDRHAGAGGVDPVAARSRRWIVAAKGWHLAGLIAIGVSITAAIEWLATRGYWIANWSYLPTMPLVPGAGIGLVPLLQWVVLPLLTVWFVRRQLTHRAKTVDQQATAS